MPPGPLPAQPARDPARTLSMILSLQVAIGVTAALYFGREILIPLALSVLLSFVLAPLVRVLQKAHIPRAGAVVLVVMSAALGVGLLTAVVASQLTQLAAELPVYERTIRSKAEGLRNLTAGSSTLGRAADMLQDLSREIDRPKTRSSFSDRAGDAAEQQPIPVEVRAADPGPLASLMGLASPLVHPLATTGLIVIFVIFILIQREDLRNRMIRLAGAHDLQRTTAAIDDAARRLSRYFLVQVALNAAFGIVIGVGLGFIGVPSPVLWGILAAVLRFVPYIGAAIAALLPLALAAAVDPGWSMVVWTAALFAIVEPLVGNVIEPLVYGQSTGLSPVAVVVAATFWTWLWGSIGLVMATPLTACLVVLGRHVDQLAMFDVMFGDTPPLSAPEVFYQRMLAGDPTEAVDQAEVFLRDTSLRSYLEDVALPGLRLAGADELRGALAPDRLRVVRDSVIELAEELSALVETTPEAGEGPSAEILCVGARTPLDEAAAALMGILARSEGFTVRVLGPQELSLANLVRLETGAARLVCVSVLEAPNSAHVRHALRRLRRRVPGATLAVGAWTQDGHGIDDLRTASAPDQVVTRFADLVSIAHALMGEDAAPEADENPQPAVA